MGGVAMFTQGWDLSCKSHSAMCVFIMVMVSIVSYINCTVNYYNFDL